MRSWSRREVLAAGAATAVRVACGGDDGGGTSPLRRPRRRHDRATTTPVRSRPRPTPRRTSLVHGVRLRRARHLQPHARADRRPVPAGRAVRAPGHHRGLPGPRGAISACGWSTATARPVAGAAVEVWHTDATGDYSAFADGGGGKDEAEGTTFLRGTQVADDDGIVEFATIYPGWYRGGRCTSTCGCTATTRSC